MRARVLSLSLALLVPLAGNAQPQETTPAQEAPPSFPGEVEQVTVDVVVTDKEGIPITGLKRGDIEVYEDGKRQTIVSYDAFHVAAAASGAPVPRPRVSTNTIEQERRGRTFVIVFDDLHFTTRSALSAKQAVARFLKNETREGDRVTLLSTGGGVWWTSRMEAGREELLEVAQHLGGGIVPDSSPDRMSDYEAMQIHVNRDNAIMNRVQRRFESYGLVTMTGQSQHVRTLSAREDPVITTRAAELYFAAASRNRISLDALERSLEALVPVKGRKSLILVSDGFIYDPVLKGFKDIVRASRRANTAIYFVSGLGLEGLPLALDAEFSGALPQEDLGFAFSAAFENAEGSESLAADTGGFTVKNSNDLAGGLKRISDETRSYYLIGYNPANTARDGKYRKIRIKIPGRKGIKIRARKGYYAPSDEDAGEKPRERSVFQTALDSPYDLDAISLRMTHVVRQETLLGRAQVFLATEVDLRGVAFEQLEDGRSTAKLDLLLVATQRETGENFRYDETMELGARGGRDGASDRSWLPYVRDFELPTGGYQARIVVRDRVNGRVGTVTHEFEIPDLGMFRVSTPVLSDVRGVTEDGRPSNELAILARREFEQGASLYCQVDVYGATRSEEGKPWVTMGFEVRRSDGTLFTEEAPSIILPTSLGVLSRMIGFSLEATPPGDYEVVMHVKDEQSGNTLELHEPFSVSAPPSAATPAPTGE